MTFMIHKKDHPPRGSYGRPWAAGVVALLLGALPAGATTRAVSNLNDSGTGSLREAIAASVDGDTISGDVKAGPFGSMPLTGMRAG